MDFETNLKLTKQQIKDSVNQDDFIIQTTNCLTELNKSINLLVKRLREWYSLYNPEASHHIKDHEKFTELINKPKKDLLKELNLSGKLFGILINGKKANEDTVIKPEDEITILPAISGGN